MKAPGKVATEGLTLPRRGAARGDPVKLSLLLALLSLGSAPLLAVPVATADHCAQYPIGMELKCEAYETADEVLAPVNCLYNTAPSQWTRYCIVLASPEADLLP